MNSMNGNDKTWSNPYGRQHLRLNGGGRGEWTSDRASLRRLRAAVRKYWSSWGPAPTLTTRPAPEPAAFSTAPSAGTMRFVLLCSLWYMTSALSSNTGKVILTQFRYPVTLTIVQFAFVAFYSLLIMSPLVGFTKIRMPTRSIIRMTLPMGAFQVGGHMFSSMAISRIPVSTVHTIKALSPLFTVAAYALLFGVSYSAKTYISLLPLTLGVMLACTFDMTASNGIGLLCAFGSAIVFVSSNIFFKKVMPSSSEKGTSTGHKLDKINLLLYSSSMAFFLMVPIWLYTDLPALLNTSSDTASGMHVAHPAHGHSAPHSIQYYFFINGTVHFAQNLIAFIILGSTSPVTYSIASLIKRVAVICIAIVWFAQRVHPVQGVGITLTFIGLWMYNGAKGSVAQGEMRARKVERTRDLVLPTTKAELAEQGDSIEDLPAPVVESTAPPKAPRGRRMSANRGAGGAPVPPPPHAAAATVPPPMGSYAHHRGHYPGLQIKITPPGAHPPAFGANVRADSYPSPPPSLDSPPNTGYPISASGAAVHAF